MPVFMCHCNACGMDFNKMLPAITADTKAKCPFCRSEDTTFEEAEKTARYVFKDGQVSIVGDKNISPFGGST